MLTNKANTNTNSKTIQSQSKDDKNLFDQLIDNPVTGRDLDKSPLMNRIKNKKAKTEKKC